jgi:hypothetical protein
MNAAVKMNSRTTLPIAPAQTIGCAARVTLVNMTFLLASAARTQPPA